MTMFLIASSVGLWFWKAPAAGWRASHHAASLAMSAEKCAWNPARVEWAGGRGSGGLSGTGSGVSLCGLRPNLDNVVECDEVDPIRVHRPGCWLVCDVVLLHLSGSWVPTCLGVFHGSCCTWLRCW